MEPVKIRGTWRFTDKDGRYRRMTEEQYQEYLNGTPSIPAAPEQLPELPELFEDEDDVLELDDEVVESGDK